MAFNVSPILQPEIPRGIPVILKIQSREVRKRRGIDIMAGAVEDKIKAENEEGHQETSSIS